MSITTIGDIARAIEQFAPTALQEDYDNSGLIIGRADEECTGVLIAFDVDEATVSEAHELGYNMIVAHHPLIFRGLKRLCGATPVERTVMAAVRLGIAIYAGHTSMDNARGGVSWRMAKLLELSDVEVLAPTDGQCEKLTTYVPRAHSTAVSDALFAAGAGHIGRYDSCSFTSEGHGTFRALDGANPFVGTQGEQHTEPETRIEVIVPRWLHGRVERALLTAHPYEEPAYEFTAVKSGADRMAGSGVVGNLAEPLTAEQLAAKVKAAFGCTVIRCSHYPAHSSISRVAMCGGSGAFLTGRAIGSGAQAFITADVKYHEFADAANEIFLVDAGHFETEHCISSIFYEIITEIFPNFAVRCSKTTHNPVIYM